jgi:amino acid transporter
MEKEKEKEVVFLRKATGLVRTWGFLDVFSFNSYGNPMLGYYTSFVTLFAAFWATGSLILAIIISTIASIFQALVYSSLVTTMPRAGGEYIWMTRIFRWPVIGFTLVLVGWVIVVMLWDALLAPALAGLFLQPIALAFGNLNLAMWFMTRDGLFFCSMIFVFVPWLFIILGMKWCGRFFSSSYVLGGLVAFAITLVILLSYDQTSFISAYNSFFSTHFGLTNAYQAALSKVADAGVSFPGEWQWSLQGTLPLLALVAYANSWCMWGAPMYGEVKGAREMKVSFWSMAGSNLFNNGLMIMFLLAWIRLTGFQFFQSANYLYGSAVYGGYFEAAMPLWPFPTHFLYILTGNPIPTLIVAIFGLYYIMIVHGLGCTYLPAIRILFSMAFDRILPAPLARLSTKRKVPLVALTVLTVLAFIQSCLYFYAPGFMTLTLIGTAVLILSFIGTALAGMLLPFVRREEWKASAASKYRLGKIPIISIAAAITIGYFLYIYYWWATDPTFGVNNLISVWFFVIVYAAVIILYFIMKAIRKRQGIDVGLAYKEIPVE